ncbi:MAG: permease [Anaerolineae bacterium]|nr:permease [Anaerolineae bacterium]
MEKANSPHANKILWWILGVALFLLATVSGVLIGISWDGGQGKGWIALVDQVSMFSTIFLGIFIEAVPYLFLGTLASGLVEVFVDQDSLLKIIPRSKLGSALAGASLGLFFPVCECGVVPLARRLFRKGLPAPVGISFLLAAPVLNPIVIASTFAAFGNTPVFWGRLAMTFLISILVGGVFAFQTDHSQVLLPSSSMAYQPVAPLQRNVIGQRTAPGVGVAQRLQKVAVIAANEFFEMGRYLVLGALLAAFMQTLIPQGWLLAVGQGPILSVLVMIALAVILSVCSTVDAFIALAFAGSFNAGSLLAFLVYGPMVDIKSTLMFLRVFRRRTVLYLVTLPLMLILLAAVAMNYFVRF